MGLQRVEPSQEHKSPIFSPTAVIAAGLSSVIAATVTSKFGVAETLIGEVLAAMISATVPAVFVACLGHAKHATSATQILRSLVQMRAALGWFVSLSPERRRPILFRGLLAGVAAFFLGMGTVTAAELSAGKSLSCWVWSNCPQDASEGTLPSVLGGGPSDDLPWIVGGDPDDAGPSITADSSPSGGEPPIMGGDPGDADVTTATRGAENNPGASTIPGGDVTGSKPESCDVNEATTGSAKKDAKSTTTIAGDGKNKGVKPCAHGETGPKDPDPAAPKEPSGQTTQGSDDHTDARGPRQGGSTVQEEPYPVREEDPSPEQPRRGLVAPNDGSLPHAAEVTSGNGA